MASAAFNYSYIFKYIIIGACVGGWVCAWRASARDAGAVRVAGDMGVGKSCLLHQFTEKKCACVRLCSLAMRGCVV